MGHARTYSIACTFDRKTLVEAPRDLVYIRYLCSPAEKFATGYVPENRQVLSKVRIDRSAESSLSEARQFVPQHRLRDPYDHNGIHRCPEELKPGVIYKLCHRRPPFSELHSCSLS